MNEFYIGLALASSTTSENGLAVLDKNFKIIRLEKLFGMGDIVHFFKNYPNLHQSTLCASIASENALLEGKWRIHSKPYLQFKGQNLINKDDWTKRHSGRAQEFLEELAGKLAGFFRYDIGACRQKLGLKSPYLNRSPLDCQFLQNSLKNEQNFYDLPENMISAALLEAIIGAIVAKNAALGNFYAMGEFKNCQIILPR